MPEKDEPIPDGAGAGAGAAAGSATTALAFLGAERFLAFLAPFLPSARSSAARSFIAARSSALKPSDTVVEFFADTLGSPLGEGSA